MAPLTRKPLPPEVRNGIYQILVDRTYPLIFRTEILHYRKHLPFKHSLPSGFLSSCKQIHEELLTFYGARGAFKAVIQNLSLEHGNNMVHFYANNVDLETSRIARSRPDANPDNTTMSTAAIALRQNYVQTLTLWIDLGRLEDQVGEETLISGTINWSFIRDMKALKTLRVQFPFNTSPSLTSDHDPENNIQLFNKMWFSSPVLLGHIIQLLRAIPARVKIEWNLAEKPVEEPIRNTTVVFESSWTLGACELSLLSGVY
ncbi:hypothetical protein EJ08DRAFT_714199 [Tothia fuscella]|uniref:Uncharacterized protein n=1 Tax=Tothia fuscella TaxID=1048955 RepID=A0A9P4TZF2_9PEZI|nr:hypothetical protein EJ08DRAFT_714199 [Tothia fuscella]